MQGKIIKMCVNPNICSVKQFVLLNTSVHEPPGQPLYGAGRHLQLVPRLLCKSEVNQSRDTASRGWKCGCRNVEFWSCVKLLSWSMRVAFILIFGDRQIKYINQTPLRHSPSWCLIYISQDTIKV